MNTYPDWIVKAAVAICRQDQHTPLDVADVIYTKWLNNQEREGERLASQAYEEYIRENAPSTEEVTT